MQRASGVGALFFVLFFGHQKGLSEMLISNFLNWRDAIVFDGTTEGGEGGGSESAVDDFDKTRAMATIEKLREFEKEAKQLRKQLAQYEGKTILDSDQATTWAEYQKLGALPELTKALQERDAHKAELATLKRAQQFREIESAIGYNATVLAQLDAADVLTYETKTVTQDGKTVNLVMVSGGKAEKEMPLQEYAAAYWKPFLPALQPATTQPGVQFATQLSGNNRPFAAVEEIVRKRRASGEYHAL